MAETDVQTPSPLPRKCSKGHNRSLAYTKVRLASCDWRKVIVNRHHNMAHKVKMVLYKVSTHIHAVYIIRYS